MVVLLSDSQTLLFFPSWPINTAYCSTRDDWICQSTKSSFWVVEGKWCQWSPPFHRSFGWSPSSNDCWTYPHADLPMGHPANEARGTLQGRMSWAIHQPILLLLRSEMPGQNKTHHQCDLAILLSWNKDSAKMNTSGRSFTNWKTGSAHCITDTK